MSFQCQKTKLSAVKKSRHIPRLVFPLSTKLRNPKSSFRLLLLRKNMLGPHYASFQLVCYLPYGHHPLLVYYAYIILSKIEEELSGMVRATIWQLWLERNKGVFNNNVQHFESFFDHVFWKATAVFWSCFTSLLANSRYTCSSLGLGASFPLLLVEV